MTNVEVNAPNLINSNIINKHTSLNGDKKNVCRNQIEREKQIIGVLL